MRSAAEAWADAREPTPARSRSRYKPMCACCAPEEEPAQAGRPPRRATTHPESRAATHRGTRPVLAWRARLAALQAQESLRQEGAADLDASLDAELAFEAVDSAGEATKMIVNEVSPC